MRRFTSRVQAGRALADQLRHEGSPTTVVLGVPRGGVPVAAEVARALGAPLDVLVVRKLGVPWQPELAMGAVGEGGVRVIDQGIVRRLGVTDDEVEAVERRERAEVDARVSLWRGGRTPLSLVDRTAIVVDDGIATGSTTRAACAVARALGAARIVLATPVAPRDLVRAFPEADTFVAVSTPRDFQAVGMHYDNFSPTTDEEVTALLAARSS